MAWIVTNWENDLIMEPEERLMKFVKEKYSNREFKFLPALRQRHQEEIFESLEESYTIIMQPHLIDKGQIASMVKLISHPIHGALNGAVRRYDIHEFVFLSSDAWETLNDVKNACNGLRDQVGEQALVKLLRNVEIHFYGFEGEHYELGRRRTDYEWSDIYATRYK